MPSIAGALGIAAPGAQVVLHAHKGSFHHEHARAAERSLSFVYVAPGAAVLRFRLRDPRGVERIVPVPPNGLLVFAACLACELVSEPRSAGAPPLLLSGDIGAHAAR